MSTDRVSHTSSCQAYLAKLIDRHAVPFDIGTLLRHFGSDVIPHHQAMALCAGFRHHGQLFPWPWPHQLDDKAHDRRDVDPGEDGNLPGIFAVGVLAHDHPIQIAGIDPDEDPGRAHVGKLHQQLADRQPMLLERKVVRHIGRTDGTERDSIEGAQLRHTALRHECAVSL